MSEQLNKHSNSAGASPTLNLFLCTLNFAPELWTVVWLMCFCPGQFFLSLKRLFEFKRLQSLEEERRGHGRDLSKSASLGCLLS